jgi:hypothetical protein
MAPDFFGEIIPTKIEKGCGPFRPMGEAKNGHGKFFFEKKQALSGKYLWKRKVAAYAAVPYFCPAKRDSRKTATAHPINSPCAKT